MSQSLPSTEDGSKAKPYKRVLAINLPADLQTIDAVTGKIIRFERYKEHYVS